MVKQRPESENVLTAYYLYRGTHIHTDELIITQDTKKYHRKLSEELWWRPAAATARHIKTDGFPRLNIRVVIISQIISRDHILHVLVENMFIIMSIFIPRSTLRLVYRCNTTQVMFLLMRSHLHVKHGHSHMVICPTDRFVEREEVGSRLMRIRQRAKAKGRGANTNKLACSRFMSCLPSKKKKKKNRNQYSKKVLKEPTATTPPWLSWVHNVFPVICLLGGGRICMESDLCWLCVTVLAVVWEVLRHKAFRKVIRYKTQTQFIFGWAGWMGSCILGQQIVFRYSKYIFQLQFGSV